LSVDSWGNHSIGPSAVWVQSLGRISSPISPPPSQCLCVTFLSMRSSAKIQLVDRHGIGWALRPRSAREHDYLSQVMDRGDGGIFAAFGHRPRGSRSLVSLACGAMRTDRYRERVTRTMAAGFGHSSGRSRIDNSGRVVGKSETIWLLLKYRLSNNVGSVKHLASTLRRALTQERHFALVGGFCHAHQGSLVIGFRS
jgi:hypothetical protein